MSTPNMVVERCVRKKVSRVGYGYVRLPISCEVRIQVVSACGTDEIVRKSDCNHACVSLRDSSGGSCSGCNHPFPTIVSHLQLTRSVIAFLCCQRLLADITLIHRKIFLSPGACRFRSANGEPRPAVPGVQHRVQSR